MRLIYFKPVTALLASAGVLGGCGTVPKDAGFADVHRIVLDRTGQRVQWNRQSNDDASATTAVRELLGQSLDADRAVQIALLNNRRLQATYEDLGVAQADVVQAGLLRNPVFDADLKFGTRGEGTTLEMAVVADFLDVFLIPLRRRVAEGQFESAKLRVTAAAIDLASRTRAAFYTHVADAQTLEMRRTVTDAAAAAFDFAKRLHTAGNVSDLAFATERAAYEQAKVDFARAEAMALDSRERFGELLGVWGPDTQWTALPRLPELPAEEISTADAERRAIEKSLDLAVEKQGVTAAAQTLGIRRSFGLFPELELGAAAERESDGGWGVGPAVSLPIPLLDQGQAATATAVAELQRARQSLFATAVEVRSAARRARNRLLAARAAADYYRRVILPLRHEITQQSQLHYNGMFIGAPQLLQAKQAEVEAGIASIDALRDYWLARTQFDHVLNGGNGGDSDAPAAAQNTSRRPGSAGGTRETIH